MYGSKDSSNVLRHAGAALGLAAAHPQGNFAQASAADCVVQSKQPPRQETIVFAITEQLNERMKHLHHHGARLQSLADRLLGCQPAGNSEGGVTGGGPTSDIQNLGALVPFMDYLLAQLASHVDRLEQL